MFSDKRCEIKCVFPYVVGIRIMSIHISCDMYLCLGLHVQIRLYYVLPYKAKISAQHGTGFILDRCIVYLGLTMPNLQKKRLLISEIFNIKRCTLFLGTEYILVNNIRDIYWLLTPPKKLSILSVPVELPGPVFTNHSLERSLSYSPDFSMF